MTTIITRLEASISIQNGTAIPSFSPLNLGIQSDLTFSEMGSYVEGQGDDGGVNKSKPAKT